MMNRIFLWYILSWLASYLSREKTFPKVKGNPGKRELELGLGLLYTQTFLLLPESVTQSRNQTLTVVLSIDSKTRFLNPQYPPALLCSFQFSKIH